MAYKTATTTNPEKETTSWWGAILLGVVFIVAGIFVLGNLALATAISTMVLGIALLIAGGAEIIQSFSAPHWRGFFLRILMGALYVIAGLMLVADPLGASIVLTLMFAIAWIASGVVRLFQSYLYWEWSGWLLLLSGVVGIVAGLIVLSKWPVSGLWVLGLLVGIDLLVHGVWWISLGFQLRQERRYLPT
jgi:uncharacterized membrane protein HdeD (DUF308 family)